MIFLIFAAPGIVNFTAQPQLSNISVSWQVYDHAHYACIIIIMLCVCVCYGFIASFQPPSLIAGFPVLHYVVSYNTSTDNSTLIHTQVNSSMTSYTVFGVPGVAYYITVIAVNALGPGPISNYYIVNGEIKVC